MESLIYSNALSSRFQIHRKSRISRLSLNSAGKLDHSPSFLPQLRRFVSFSSNFVSVPRFVSRLGDNNLLELEPSLLVSSPDEDSSDGANPTLHFEDRYSYRQKAKFILLLSTIAMTLIHPIIVPSALAGGTTMAASGSKLLKTEVLSSAWTGFLAGCLHTLSGPDHLAALAPLSIGRSKLESAAVGALWGCGHDAGQLIFGLIFLLLKDRLHIEILKTWGTRVVGLTLLIIGAMGIREASEAVVVPEFSGGYEGFANKPEFETEKKKKIGFATFATGIVHGLQPDALMMVLPALALPSRVAGAAFLGMFLIGTVVAMGSYTVFIGSCSEALKSRVPRITEKLTWISSIIAIAFGVALLLSQYFGFSLY